jgi:hypothetical protein
MDWNEAIDGSPGRLNRRAGGVSPRFLLNRGRQPPPCQEDSKDPCHACLTAPPAEVEPEGWKTFLEELGRKLPGVGSLHEAVLHGDEAVRYQVLRQLEIQLATLADEGLRNHLNNWLYALYHEALRVPPLSKLSLHPIELEGAGGETEIPSEPELFPTDVDVMRDPFSGVH